MILRTSSSRKFGKTFSDSTFNVRPSNCQQTPAVVIHNLEHDSYVAIERDSAQALVNAITEALSRLPKPKPKAKLFKVVYLGAAGFNKTVIGKDFYINDVEFSLTLDNGVVFTRPASKFIAVAAA